MRTGIPPIWHLVKALGVVRGPSYDQIWYLRKFNEWPWSGGGGGGSCMVFVRVFGFHLPLLFRVEEDEN